MAKIVKQHLQVDIFGKYGSELNRSSFEKALRATLDNLILISKIGNKKTEISYLVTEIPITNPSDDRHA